MHTSHRAFTNLGRLSISLGATDNLGQESLVSEFDGRHAVVSNTDLGHELRSLRIEGVHAYLDEAKMVFK